MINLFNMNLFCLISRYEFKKKQKKIGGIVKPTFKNNSVAVIFRVLSLFFLRKLCNCLFSNKSES